MRSSDGGFDFFDKDFRSWVFSVQSSKNVFFLDRTVVFIYHALHKIENQAFVEIGSPSRIMDSDGNAKVAGKQCVEFGTLSDKHLTIVERLLRFDRTNPARAKDYAAAVCLGCRITQDGEGSVRVLF